MIVFNGTNFYPMLYRFGKELVDLSARFLISKGGEIYSVQQKKILKTTVHKKGHRRVIVSFNGKKHEIKVHTAMGYSFLDLASLDSTHSVIHIDKNKENNNLDNLKIEENTKINSANGGSNRRIIRCVQTGEVFRSISEVDKWLGLTDHGRTVRRHLEGKLPNVAGFSFEEEKNE